MRFQQRSHNTSPANWCGYLQNQTIWRRQRVLMELLSMMSKGSCERKTFSSKGYWHLDKLFFMCFLYSLWITKVTQVRIYEKMSCFFIFLLSRHERVSTEDKNPMVRSVTFYELNSKNRITATGIAKDRQKEECTLSKWLTSISLAGLLAQWVGSFSGPTLHSLKISRCIKATWTMICFFLRDLITLSFTLPIGINMFTTKTNNLVFLIIWKYPSFYQLS